MRLFIVKPADPEETRVPLLPAEAGKLVKLGAQVEVESGLGQVIEIADTSYEAAGARVSTDREASLTSAHMVLRVDPPAVEQNPVSLRLGCIHI